jgi:hypothetical protein
MAKKQNKIKKIYTENLLPRFFYVERYLNDTVFSSKLSKKEQNKIHILKENAETELKAVKFFNILSTILYVAIYFSIVSFFLSNIPLSLFSEIIGKISRFIGFIGTPVFLLIQFIILRLKNIRYEKLMLYTSHLISYSTKE